LIGLILIATAAAGLWAWKTRDPQATRIGDIAAVVAALVALKLFKTNLPLGLLALAGAGWWLWFRRRGPKSGGMSREEAGRLLDVRTDATAEEVRAAHRRLVRRVHPDVGGSADLTRRVNAARDALLRSGT
jgi:DnaJ homolog subfamily C member 19